MSLISSLTKSYNTSNQSIDDIITQDGGMIRIKEKIIKTSDSDAHVLVYGKTGTGKELIVNAIQKTSKRKDAPFIKQNWRGDTQHSAGEYPLWNDQGQLYRSAGYAGII